MLSVQYWVLRASYLECRPLLNLVLRGKLQEWFVCLNIATHPQPYPSPFSATIPYFFNSRLNCAFHRVEGHNCSIKFAYAKQGSLQQPGVSFGTERRRRRVSMRISEDKRANGSERKRQIICMSKSRRHAHCIPHSTHQYLYTEFNQVFSWRLILLWPFLHGYLSWTKLEMRAL